MESMGISNIKKQIAKDLTSCHHFMRWKIALSLPFQISGCSQSFLQVVEVGARTIRSIHWCIGTQEDGAHGR